jgi:hypothetical protein
MHHLSLEKADTVVPEAEFEAVREQVSAVWRAAMEE